MSDWLDLDLNDARTLADAATVGFFGRLPDPTPNVAYALPGAGPNPETDFDARATARTRLLLLADYESGRPVPTSAPEPPTEPEVPPPDNGEET